MALLKLLLEENNLLLMDEPTNHLDMDSKATLEEALINYSGSLDRPVSHDRWFLDQVVNRIWELQDGVVTVYYGNYTDYVRARKAYRPWLKVKCPMFKRLSKQYLSLHRQGFV